MIPLFTLPSDAPRWVREGVRALIIASVVGAWGLFLYGVLQWLRAG